MKKSAITANQSSSENRHTDGSVGAVVTHLSVARANNKPEKPQGSDSDFDFSALESAIRELPSMDATKMVALHRRIVNGDYKFQSDHIAEKLIELESSLNRP